MSDKFISNEKYETTGETWKIYGTVLHRIRAKKNLGLLRAGALGGWVEKESNLSADGASWIYGNSKVFDDAVVSEGARIDGANIQGNAKIYGRAKITGDLVTVYGNAEIYGNARVNDRARVHGNAKIYGNADIYDYVNIGENAEICGGIICGNILIGQDARISKTQDCITIGPIGPDDEYLTAFRTVNGGIGVKQPRFTGTLEEFLERVDNTHGNNDYGKVYRLVAEMIHKQFEMKVDI